MDLLSWLMMLLGAFFTQYNNMEESEQTALAEGLQTWDTAAWLKAAGLATAGIPDFAKTVTEITVADNLGAFESIGGTSSALNESLKNLTIEKIMMWIAVGLFLFWIFKSITSDDDPPAVVYTGGT